MIIIKTTNGDVFVNEKTTQIVQHDKQNKMVVIRSSKEGLNCNIQNVEGIIYTNDAQPTSWQDEGSALEKARKDCDKNGMVKFNLNNEILVEITDKGWERLTEKNIEQYIDHCIKLNEVKIGEKTYYKLQAHQLGELFEPADWATAIGPVKPVVMLYWSDLEDVKEE